MRCRAVVKVPIVAASSSPARAKVAPDSAYSRKAGDAKLQSSEGFSLFRPGRDRGGVADQANTAVAHCQRIVDGRAEGIDHGLNVRDLSAISQSVELRRRDDGDTAGVPRECVQFGSQLLSGTAADVLDQLLCGQSIGDEFTNTGKEFGAAAVTPPEVAVRNQTRG